METVGKEGRYEEGERVIDDPMEVGRRYSQKVNVRESALEHMASRGRLDASQAEAGARFRKLWEQAAIGRSQAIDMGKEGVDGGGFMDPISDELVRSSRELAKAMEVIGQIGCRILIGVIGEGKRIEDMAHDWSRAGGIVSGRRAEGYVTGTMVDALDILVRHWRLQAEGSPKQRPEPGYYKRKGEKVYVYDDIRASGPIAETGPSREVRVGRFGDTEVQEIRPVDKGPLTVHASGNSGKYARRR